MVFITWLIQCLLILLSIAFFTLFERKIMGLFHRRLGPNKVRFIGLLQPILDGAKLFLKQNLIPHRANRFIYNLAPIIALFLSLFLWVTLPGTYIVISMNYSIVLFFLLRSIMVFSVLLSGWASNSKYSLIGRLRSVAQSISYESVFRTLIVLVILLVSSYSIRSFFVQSSILFLFFFPLWIICTLAETHRTPFDFAESESELVSGFNTEYSGALFAFLFLSEYSMILYSCYLITYLFFMWILPLNYIVISFFTLLVNFLIIWIRITYPRYRYDILMILSWKILLPFTLAIFCCFIPLIL